MLETLYLVATPWNREEPELRLLLGVDEKDYALFAGFRRFAIEPAISEISNKTDLFIHDVKYGKTGRKITNVTFFALYMTKK
jgi:plasmid replication initiation protein